MPPHAGYANPKNSLENDPHCLTFLKACEENDLAVASQLAPNREFVLLTFGLNRAIEHNHFDLASHLLKAGATWDTRTVHLLSESHEAVRWLVESGYDVNTSVAYGHVLLVFVVGRNDEASIRYLLERGANPNRGGSKETTAPASEMRSIPHCGNTLNGAAASCTPEIFALLLSHGAVLSNATPLHYAAVSRKDDRIPMLEYLIEELDLDINGFDYAPTIPEECWGRDGTPLHYALKNQKYETAKWLLEHGADPNKPMKPEYPESTPRMWIRNIQHDNRFSELLSRYPVE